MRGFPRVALLTYILIVAGCAQGSRSVSVHIDPESADVVVRTSQTFTSRVDGTFGREVTWSIQAGPGSISSNGVYSAPLVVPSETANQIVVRVTSVVDPALHADALVRIVEPPLSPRHGPTIGGTRVTVTGSGFKQATTSILFAGIPGTGLDVLSQSVLQVTVPRRAAPGGATGFGPVPVEIDEDGATLAVYPGAFSYGATDVVFPGARQVAFCHASDATMQDLDGDGFADLVVVCSNTYVQVSRGDGLGGFHLFETLFDPNVRPDSVSFGDFDGDGRADVGTFGLGTGTVAVAAMSIFHNDGSSFSLSPQNNTGIYARSFTFADFDGDDKADIVWGEFLNGMGIDAFQIALNDGTGAFNSYATVATIGSTAIAVGDVDGDQLNDVVATTTTGFSLFFGDGHGAFPTRVDVATGQDTPGSVLLADFDHDGTLDIVTGSADESTAGLMFMHGNGGGGFATGVAFGDGEAADAVSLSARDMDGDGYPDVLAALPGDSIARIFFGGPVGFSPSTAIITGVSGNAIHTGRLFGKQSDLVDLSATAVRTFAPVAPRTYVPPPMIASVFPIGVGELPASGPFRGVAFVDDPFPDPPQLTFFRVDATSSSGLTVASSVEFPSADFTPTAVIGVEAAPGHPATLLFPSFAPAVGVFPALLYAVVATSGGFSAPVNIHDAINGPIVSAALGDLDGDGIPDLVTSEFANGGEGAVVVSWGMPNGGYAAGTKLALWLAPVAVAIADIDGDGRPELLVADRLADTVSIVSFDAGGTPASVSLDVGASPSSLNVADLDGDGKPELILASQTDDALIPEMVVFPALGSRQFGDRLTFVLPKQPSQTILRDLDGDGLLDLVVLDKDQRLLVLRGEEGDRFSDPDTFDLQDPPEAIAPVDLDGDGIVDLVSTRAILRNLSR